MGSSLVITPEELFILDSVHYTSSVVRILFKKLQSKYELPEFILRLHLLYAEQEEVPQHKEIKSNEDTQDPTAVRH